MTSYEISCRLAACCHIDKENYSKRGSGMLQTINDQNKQNEVVSRTRSNIPETKTQESKYTPR